MHLPELGRQRRGRDAVPDLPPGAAERLATGRDRQSPVRHARERGQRDVRRVVGQVRTSTDSIGMASADTAKSNHEL